MCWQLQDCNDRQVLADVMDSSHVNRNLQIRSEKIIITCITSADWSSECH